MDGWIAEMMDERLQAWLLRPPASLASASAPASAEWPPREQRELEVYFQDATLQQRSDHHSSHVLQLPPSTIYEVVYHRTVHAVREAVLTACCLMLMLDA